VLKASEVVGIEIYTEEAKRIVSHYQNIGQYRNLLNCNKSFENMVKLKYLETTVTNQYCIDEEIQSRLSLENALCHSLQSLLSSLKTNIELCKSTFFRVIFYMCET
jgi:prephenate dehydratase